MDAPILLSRLMSTPYCVSNCNTSAARIVRNETRPPEAFRIHDPYAPDVFRHNSSYPLPYVRAAIAAQPAPGVLADAWPPLQITGIGVLPSTLSA